MHLYDNQFSERYDFPVIEKPSKVLIIASTGRSGSHMLGHALQKCNSFGFPLEYVNRANFAEWKKRFGKESFNEVLSEIQRHRTSPNGVFGIKVHYSHINEFGGFNRLKETFPEAYYIHLTRKNALKQAVSMSIAEQTGVWISGQKPKNANPRYSFSSIDNSLRQIIMDDASWRYILEMNSCNYLEMDFDYIRNNLALSILEVAKFMKIDIDPEAIPRDHITKKQSSKINDEWEKKALADYRSAELFRSRKLKYLFKVFG